MNDLIFFGLFFPAFIGFIGYYSLKFFANQRDF